MGLFLSTAVNKIDKKGRVSVPSIFRNEINGLGQENSVILLPSPQHACLEGFEKSFFLTLSSRLDRLDLFSDQQDDLATALFGEAVPLPIDKDGRIILPASLMSHANLNEEAVFVGLGTKFQIWEPGAFKARKQASRDNIKQKGWTLSGSVQEQGGQTQ